MGPLASVRASASSSRPHPAAAPRSRGAARRIAPQTPRGVPPAGGSEEWPLRSEMLATRVRRPASPRVSGPCDFRSPVVDAPATKNRATGCR
eukprot:scaffold1603_cov415-Prasinococcus_capsulatus_cf.AAC.20